MIHTQSVITLHNKHEYALNRDTVFVIAEDCSDISDVSLCRNNIKKLQKGWIVVCIGVTDTVLTGKTAIVLFEGVRHYILTRYLTEPKDYVTE